MCQAHITIYKLFYSPQNCRLFRPHRMGGGRVKMRAGAGGAEGWKRPHSPCTSAASPSLTHESACPSCTLVSSPGKGRPPAPAAQPRALLERRRGLSIGRPSAACSCARCARCGCRLCPAHRVQRTAYSARTAVTMPC